MKTPDKPANEKERLSMLHSLKILDTDPEERFDRITRLARRVFNVPIALISLVDENRQWFKSRQGLEIAETPRDMSLSGHAILGNDIFVIDDARNDERFADNPFVLEPPYARFYAGCPLRYLDGSKLGTLCIIDSKPRSISAEDLTALSDLAELVEQEIGAVQLATLDDLTKISNRRGFVTLAHNSLNLCARQSVPVSMVYFDLDNFKSINDSHGHGEGDLVLIAFAEQMKKSFRDSDVFARIGGDEFAVLLTNASQEFTAEIIDRLRFCVNAYNQEAKRGYDIEFSEGIVTVNPDQNYSVSDLLEEADVLMYENKPG